MLRKGFLEKNFMLCANKFHCLLLRVLAPSHHKHILSIYMKLVFWTCSTLSIPVAAFCVYVAISHINNPFQQRRWAEMWRGYCDSRTFYVWKNFLHLVQTNFIAYYMQQNLLDIQTECSSIHSWLHAGTIWLQYSVDDINRVRQIFVCNWEFWATIFMCQPLGTMLIPIQRMQIKQYG